MLTGSRRGNIRCQLPKMLNIASTSFIWNMWQTLIYFPLLQSSLVRSRETERSWACLECFFLSEAALADLCVGILLCGGPVTAVKCVYDMAATGTISVRLRSLLPTSLPLRLSFSRPDIITQICAYIQTKQQACRHMKSCGAKGVGSNPASFPPR